MLDLSDAFTLIDTSSDPGPIVEIMNNVLAFEENSRSNIAASGLRALDDLKYDGFADVAIDLCFRLSESDVYAAQERLELWFVTQPDDSRQTVIDRLLRYLTNEENEDELLRAVDTLTVIGFRTDVVDQRLHELLHSSTNEAVRTAVIWALTWLGSPNVNPIISAIKEILGSNAYDYRIPNSIKLLATAELLPDVVVAYSRLSENDMTLSAFLRVLAHSAWENPDRSNVLWQHLTNLPQNLIERNINVAGDVASYFNAENVPDYFLRQILPSYASVDRFGRIPRYAPYQRLVNLFLPDSLHGLHNSRYRRNEDLISTIAKDAVEDTGNSSPTQTVKTIEKEYAWQVALMLALPELFDWFPDSLNEANSFVKSDVAEIAGILKAASAIPALRDTISEPNIHPILRNHVLLALGFIGTPEAMNALLNVRIPDDLVSVNLSHGLTAAAICTHNLEPMIRALEETENVLLKIAIAASLEFVAGVNKNLLFPYRDILLRLLGGPLGQDERIANYLLLVIAPLDLDSNGLQLALDLTKSPSVSVKVRAAIVLAQHNSLLEYPDVCESLGFQINDQHCILTRLLSPDEAVLIGILYRIYPKQFSSAIRQIAETDTGHMLRIVQLFNSSLEPIDLSPILDIIANNVQANLRAIVINSDLIKALALNAPRKLIGLINDEGFASLPPHVRMTLAQNTNYALTDKSSTESANILVSAMLMDSSKAVRMEAISLLAKSDQSFLMANAQQLCVSDLPQHRRYGIEAAVACNDNTSFSLLRASLMYDREFNVREAARNAAVTRKHKELAEHYLAEIQHADPASLLDVWHFGNALILIGDESTARQLRQLASATTPDFNKRAWFASLSNKISARYQMQMNQTGQSSQD